MDAFVDDRFQVKDWAHESLTGWNQMQKNAMDHDEARSSAESTHFNTHGEHSSQYRENKKLCKSNSPGARVDE